jgi:predicted acyl esterase
VVKAWLAVLAAALVLSVGEATGAAFANEDVVIPMDDGVSIVATLYVPEGAAPTGGWPALVFLHGLSGNRTQMNTLVEAYGFQREYAVLTFDARGHGESGGLVTIDGPREVKDTRAVRDWLAARPEVSDTKIGAWGISYGGGAIFNSLVAGVPWTAAATVETWTDLYSALMPQRLVKSGLVAGLAGSIPEAKRDPSLAVLQAAAFGGNTAAVRTWAEARSSLSKLGSVKTPVLMAQGRRDFLFGIDQGSRAFQRLKGPKALYVGLHGHAPSTFPAADTNALMTRVRAWFDRYVKGRSSAPRVPSFMLASDRPRVHVTASSALPKTIRTQFVLPGNTNTARRGKLMRTVASPLESAVDVYGAPTVSAEITPSGGWSRLVAVLTAKTPAGQEILVSAGGVPTSSTTRKVVIRLVDQATYLPRGSKLTLTLASSSTAQSTSNLLYLDLPMPDAARVRVGKIVLSLPVLRAALAK